MKGGDIMKKRNYGFTLIELLIVVAIIAILAAIAIPNFLAAQMRSKVSRVRAETRTVATALESYYVDNNAYPPMGDFTWSGHMGEPDFHSRIPAFLTTPIAYISSLPIDPFLTIPAGTFPFPFYNRYTYFNFRQFNESLGLVSATFLTRFRQSGAWLIYSWGPDRAANTTASPPLGQHGVYTNYDPTNGLVSAGNIIRTQRNTERIEIDQL